MEDVVFESMEHRTRVEGATPRARANLPLLDCYNRLRTVFLFWLRGVPFCLRAANLWSTGIRAKICDLRRRSVFWRGSSNRSKYYKSPQYPPYVLGKRPI